MNADQEKIQAMIFELIEAMRQYPYNPSEIVEITTALPGIIDGTFFDRSAEDQRGLGWVNGAFFGRGERGIPLQISGALREHFQKEFSELLHKYWASDVFPQPEPTSKESQRAVRKLSESIVKENRVKQSKKANKPVDATASSSIVESTSTPPTHHL